MVATQYERGIKAKCWTFSRLFFFFLRESPPPVQKTRTHWCHFPTVALKKVWFRLQFFHPARQISEHYPLPPVLSLGFPTALRSSHSSRWFRGFIQCIPLISLNFFFISFFCLCPRNVSRTTVATVTLYFYFFFLFSCTSQITLQSKHILLNVLRRDLGDETHRSTLFGAERLPWTSLNTRRTPRFPQRRRLHKSLRCSSAFLKN